MWAGHKERRAGAGLRQPFAESNTAAGRFPVQDVRHIHFREDFATDFADFFEQKATKLTKGRHLPGFLRLLLLKFFPMSALMKNSESVKSVKSVVHFIAQVSYNPGFFAQYAPFS
jgi:hypothetical protein